MRGSTATAHRLLPGALLLAASTAATAAGLRFSVDPGMLADDAAVPQNNHFSSGVDLAMQHSLLEMAVDYDFQVQADDSFRATGEDTAQRLGASLKSRMLDRLLGVNTRMLTDSLYWTSLGTYQHRFNPGVSRRLADFATLDVNYQMLVTKPDPTAVAQEQHGYSVGLRGALQGGRLHWNGTWSSADIYRDGSLPIQNNETLRLGSSYRFLPGIQVQFSTAVTEVTRFRTAANDRFLQTHLGAGLHWQPSPAYAIDLTVNQTFQSQNGQAILLRQGRVSWTPDESVRLSLNYGDQLVEGTPGVVINTRLLLNRF